MTTEQLTGSIQYTGLINELNWEQRMFMNIPVLGGWRNGTSVQTRNSTIKLLSYSLLTLQVVQLLLEHLAGLSYQARLLVS